MIESDLIMTKLRRSSDSSVNEWQMSFFLVADALTD